MRYIITRSCLQEGGMRLLKYNEALFPASGPATFVDERGEEHAVQIDRDQLRVLGLGRLFHRHNLGVNDVLIVTPLEPGRYGVETVVKPYAPAPAPREAAAAPVSETRRVVVSRTPHVREVRLQTVGTQAAQNQVAQSPAAQAPAPQAQPVQSVQPQPTQVQAAQAQPAPPQPAPPQPGAPAPANRSEPRAAPATRREERAALTPVAAQTATQTTAQPPVVVPTGPGDSDEDRVSEFARLSGYRLEYPAPGLLRLKADLGPQYGYSVLLAAGEAATRRAEWSGGDDDHRLLLCAEAQRPAGHHRLTREALAALSEHARLAPLSPVDLRGYWRAGDVDLESAASVAELVSAHLAQRGTFSFVLLTLAQQPAHSVVSVPRLAERLGSGVNTAELNMVLDTLTRAPFLALTPLPGGQYLLRTGVGDLLGDLADYAQGVRRRVRTPVGAGHVNA
ncbi:hypothetical protein [Deinococcus petrolearius]|uniref:Uncharacterized protein n=1 Tax=Deinococcus petrolearius TaxID=1751295 RepID=A0ABW1DJE8_9DEIO